MMLPDPCPAITRAACLMPASTARKCTAMIASNCSRSTSANAAYCDDLPALLMRQSSRPKRSTACAIIRSTSASIVTSVRMKLALVPSARANLSPRSARRPAITTCAPSSTNISAVRAPMPLVAPVMTATLPASVFMSGLPDNEMRGSVPPDVRPLHDLRSQTPPTGGTTRVDRRAGTGMTPGGLSRSASDGFSRQRAERPHGAFDARAPWRTAAESHAMSVLARGGKRSARCEADASLQSPVEEHLGVDLLRQLHPEHEAA